MYQIRIKHNGNRKNNVEEKTYVVSSSSQDSVVVILDYLEDDENVSEYGVIDDADLSNLEHRHLSIEKSAYPKFKDFR